MCTSEDEGRHYPHQPKTLNQSKTVSTNSLKCSYKVNPLVVWFWDVVVPKTYKRLHYWPEYKSPHKIQYYLCFPLGLGVHFVSNHQNIATQINKKYRCY